MKDIHFLLILCVFIIRDIRIIEGQCGEGTTVGSDPITDNAETTVTGATFLLNSVDNVYRIGCCGFITQWKIHLETTGTLYAEVWRDVGGTWTLVGVNAIPVNDEGPSETPQRY